MTEENLNKKLNKTKHWIATYKTHAELIYEIDADVYQNEKLTEEEIKIVTSLAERELQKEVRNPILDLACGSGRHTIYLAKLGYDVIGLDYSPGFLEIAGAKASQLGTKGVRFIQGDIRNLPFPIEGFSTVFLLGNSFGYFRDLENEKIISEIFKVLKEDGVFVFDITDKKLFLEDLKSYARYEVNTPSFGLVIDERWKEWDEKTKRIKCRKKHTIKAGKILLDTPYNIRLYDIEEIKNLLTKIGFKNIATKRLGGERGLGLMQKRIFISCLK